MAPHILVSSRLLEMVIFLFFQKERIIPYSVPKEGP
jgi:hypothetical protein